MLYCKYTKLKLKGFELVRKIKRSQVSDMLARNKRIFGAKFEKKNKELRTGSFKLGVTKYLSGGELKYDPIAKGLIPVFDMNINEYRMINLNTLIELTIKGEKIEIEDD